MPGALQQARETPIDVIAIGGNGVALRGIGSAKVGTHGQVLLHCELTEYTTALRHQRQAARRHDMRRQAGHRLTIQQDSRRTVSAQRSRCQQAGNGLERAALAGAIGTDQGHQLALGHL